MFQPGSQPNLALDPAAVGRDGRVRPELKAPPEFPSGMRAGPKLRLAREALSLSVDYVADRIKVRADYLAALEAMNVKLLPGKAYALAYLTSYARFLNMDVDAIKAQFQSECALSREDAQPQLRDPESKPSKGFPPWFAALIIAFAAMGFVGYRALKDQAVDPRLVTTAEQAAPAPAAPALPAPAPALAPVELRAVAASWLEVRGPDGTIFISTTLQPGQGYRPDVGAGWTIHAKDGGAFEVFVDGVKIGPLGDAGKPVLGLRVDAVSGRTPTG
jgi:transcriptional regulator with XRE-family HTH domain